MAGNFNKVLLLGNLTRDVEIKHFPSGGQVGRFAIAVNERYKDRDGNFQERANFIDCEAFGRTAEVMAQYLRKGRPVFIEGKLRLDQWERDGEKRSKLKVVVDNFQFVDSGGGGGGGGGGSDRSSGGSSYDSDPGPDMGDDDIPF